MSCILLDDAAVREEMDEGANDKDDEERTDIMDERIQHNFFYAEIFKEKPLVEEEFRQ